MDYTPEQLRKWADNTQADLSQTIRAQLRAHADLLDRYSKLKAHAEAMADGLTFWDDYCGAPDARVMAYRADCIRLLLDCTLVSSVQDNHNGYLSSIETKELATVAQRHGVDQAEIRKRLAAAAKPTEKRKSNSTVEPVIVEMDPKKPWREPKPAKAKKANARAGKTKAPRKPSTADFMKPMQPSAELAAVIGEAARPRTEVTAALWAYIKKHDLQDKTNRRMINADDKLTTIFGGKTTLSMFEMTKAIAKRLFRAPS